MFDKLKLNLIMSTIYNIYKTLYLNSNKNSKKTIFTNSINNKSYIKNSYHTLFKNISLINPKSFIQKKSIKKNKSKKDNILKKMKFFRPINTQNRNNKNKKNRNFIICSPNNKSNYIKKKLILTNNSNSNSINLTKVSIEQKIHRKIKNENKILMTYKREKNKLSNLIDKQKIEIEKLKNKKNTYNKKLLILEKENKLLNNKIEEYSNNQDQLILLIKIIQNCGIDLDKLIDDYNNNIENYIENSNAIEDSGGKYNDSISDLKIKQDSNSFIPISIEKTQESKISKIEIPKLNFEKINKNNKNHFIKIINK